MLSNDIAFIGQVLGGQATWTCLMDLLQDIRTRFGADTGYQWPASGTAIIDEATAPRPDHANSLPINIDGIAPGEWWFVPTASLSEATAEVIAQALGHSKTMIGFHGTFIEQSQQINRLKDVGAAAGSLAHDMNNVFQPILGFAQLAFSKLAPSSPAYGDLQESITAIDLGTKYVARLRELFLSGEAKPLPGTISIALGRELQRLTPNSNKVTFNIDIAKNLPSVAIDTSCIQIVLGHLLNNAVEASPKAGQVTIQTNIAELNYEQSQALLGHAYPGQYVELTIADQGPGIDEATQKKMFIQPFFTTKFRHKGMGLSVVYRLLYAHNAGIAVQSRPGLGTVARVLLPILERKPIAQH